ncbi:NfeD family protein [Halobellus ruber]|uniref:NfeD family protein n=1 Tax=Halobellus ruber TaxID=2761102 RepID=A0A7J9SFG9_9EURY|nr:NfeD family protein [Halobellus ruber]MBB6645715.1 NfeD family protein [Halobellus ruber]
MLEPSVVAIQLSVPPGTLPLVLVAAGLGLGVLEALAPGAHFIVLGVALLAAGLVGLVLGPLASPLVLGVFVLVFGALALYGYRELDVYGGKGTGRTSDSTSLRGRTGRVTERVTPTEGEVKLDQGGFNPLYSARSVDGEIPEGTEVMVVDPGGGNVVTVESMSGAYDDIDRKLDAGRAAAEPDEASGGSGTEADDTPTAGAEDEDQSRNAEEDAETETERV